MKIKVMHNSRALISDPVATGLFTVKDGDTRISWGTLSALLRCDPFKLERMITSGIRHNTGRQTVTVTDIVLKYIVADIIGQVIDRYTGYGCLVTDDGRLYCGVKRGNA